MTSIQAQRIVDASLETAAAECRIQAATQASIRQSMSLEAMLEWYGSDLANNPSPAGFKTAVQAIKAYQEALCQPE